MADTLPDGVLQAPDYPAIPDAWIKFKSQFNNCTL